MSLDYKLVMASRLNKEQAFHLLAQRFDASLSEDKVTVYREGLLVFGANLTPDRSTEMYEESFHFAPTLLLSFRWDKECDHELFYRMMLRASMSMLEHAGDAVLVLYSDTVFQRLGGRLIFNMDRDVWWEGKEKLLQEEVHVPYELGVLPRLL